MFIMFIYLKQASPTAANIHNRWLSSRRQRSLWSPMMMVEPSSRSTLSLASSSFSMSSKTKRVSLTMMVVRHPFLRFYH